MVLTVVSIKKTKPGKKPRKLTDGGGLYLQIAPTGGKLWRFDYRFEGKRKTLALGKYPDVSLQDARERHQEARKLLSQGVDSSQQRQRRVPGRQIHGLRRYIGQYESRPVLFRITLGI